MAKVDLASTPSNTLAKAPAKNYPSVTLYGVDGLDLDAGAFSGTVSGIVKKASENDDGTCDYVIELRSLDAKNGKQSKSLEDDLDEIESKKKEDMSDEDEEAGESQDEQDEEDATGYEE